MTQSEEQEHVALFTSYKTELDKRVLSNNEAYDKAILSLSSAGLALSLTFIKDILPPDQITNICQLKFAWVLFLLAITSTVVSYLVGNKAIEKQLEIAQEYYLDKNEEAFKQTNEYSELNDLINRTSGVLFLLALFLVVSFVISNFNQGDLNKMSKNKIGPIYDSASVPSMTKVGNAGSTGKHSATVPAMQKVPTSSGGGNAGGSTSGSQSGGSSSSGSSDGSKN